MTAIAEVQEQLSEDFGVVTGHGTARRLSETTRRLAAKALSGESGRQMRTAEFGLDDGEVGDLDPNLHYARAVMWIAEKAPLLIVPGERIVGAATLLEAAQHRTPITEFGSISHTTIDYETGVRIGCRGLRERVERRLARGDLDESGTAFLQACLTCLGAMRVWHARYVKELEERAGVSSGEEWAAYGAALEGLRRVPENPPGNFREAVQSLWFLHAFQRLCGNWSGVGRIDKILGPYLRQDLDAGRITLDQARELIAHFWIRGCEWIGAEVERGGSGDAQFYQNIVLAGVDEEGNDVTNEVTYLVLDVVEELHISEFPVAVRVSRNTPEKLLRRIAEAQRRGGGIVAIYNEDVILPALTRFGYPVSEARKFANDGCWEIIVPGKTAFSYRPFDTLKILQEAIGLGPENLETPDFPDFESLYVAFRRKLADHLEEFHRGADEAYRSGSPAPLLSMFVEDCIARARGYLQRGTHYRVVAPHAGGLPDTANSLLVIKKLVFDEGSIGLQEFLQVLRDNWGGHEELRRDMQQRFTLYGNDDPEADTMLGRVYDDYVELAGLVREREGVLRPPGISTFGREVSAFRESRAATPFGRYRQEVLATNLAPTPGTDQRGPTAVIKSFCSLDFGKLPNGVPLELKIHPAALEGEHGIAVLVSLMRTFVELGGIYLQIDVVDSALLRDAQQHPEKYPNLSVRISGWSARFATLSKEWQDMIIQRTEQMLGE